MITKIIVTKIRLYYSKSKTIVIYSPGNDFSLSISTCINSSGGGALCRRFRSAFTSLPEFSGNIDTCSPGSYNMSEDPKVVSRFISIVSRLQRQH